MPSSSLQSLLLARFRAGATPAKLIAEGYARSTVYQVHTIYDPTPTSKARIPKATLDQARVLRAPPHSLTLEAIAAILNISSRTVHDAVRGTTPPPNRSFMNRDNLWTAEQDEYLRIHYHNAEREALVAALGHPWPSIANRASRAGLRRAPSARRPRTPTPAPAITPAPPLPPPPAPQQLPEADAIALFILHHGVTQIPPVGDPAIQNLPPMRWDRTARRATRRPA